MQLPSENERANRLAVLLTPGFICGLGLLLLNDFFLKPAFHSWLTGKLSDFAGLFIFPLFITAFFPRIKRPVYLATAVLFLLWKSAYIRPFIGWWNYHIPLPVGRVEDLTDAVALLALPLSYLYESRAPGKRGWRPAACSICILSVFAFTATSYSSVEQGYHNVYNFPISQAQLVDRIEYLGKVRLSSEGILPSTVVARRKESARTAPRAYEIKFQSGAASIESAMVEVSESKGLGKIRLMTIKGRGRSQAEKWRLAFEQEFIEPLKHDVESASPKIDHIILIDVEPQ